MVKLSGGWLLLIVVVLLAGGGAVVALDEQTPPVGKARGNMVEHVGTVLIYLGFLPAFVNGLSGLGSYRAKEPALCSGSFAPPVCDWEPPVSIWVVVLPLVGTLLMLLAAAHRFTRWRSAESGASRSTLRRRVRSDLIGGLTGIVVTATVVAFSIDPGNNL